MERAEDLDARSLVLHPSWFGAKAGGKTNETRKCQKDGCAGAAGGAGRGLADRGKRHQGRANPDHADAGAGAGLGAIFGLVTAIAGLTGADGGTQALIQANAFWTLATCIVKATAAGWVAGLVYRALRKHQTLGCVAAAISAPVVNTGLFLLAMTTVLRPSLEAWAGGTNLVYYVFVVLTGVNFLVEFGVNAVLSVAIARIVQVVGKKG